MEKRIRKQLEAWRDSYINLSPKRNNMLHSERDTTDAIVFECNSAFGYETFWEIACGNGGHEEYALQSDANSDPRYNPISWRSERERENPRDLTLLDEMVKSCYKSVVQKGENPLCLAFGRLTWRVKSERESENEGGRDAFTEIRTPVLLIPVKLNKRGVNYWLKPSYEEGMLNPALLLKYAQEGYMSFPLPACGEWLDESFDIKAYFELLEGHFSGGDCRFDKEYVGLDVFEYDRMCMYRDVARHMEELRQNPVIRALFGEKLCRHEVTVGLDGLDPAKNFPILDTNTSQSNVLERFVNGESFILEGPPGTGKTQTIVNMISEGVMHGKSVLFVSGKMSALNTVLKKMQFEGTNLDKHCLLIKGEKETGESSLSDVYAKLQAAYDAPPPVIDERAYRENLGELKGTRDILVGYNREFYDDGNSLGLSPYGIIGRMLLLGYNENHIPVLGLKESFLDNLSRKTLEEYTGRMAAVEQLLSGIFRRFGSVEKDVWYGYTGEPDFETENRLRAFRSEFAAAIAGVKEIFDGDEGMRALRKQPLYGLETVLRESGEGLARLYCKDKLTAEKEAVGEELDLSETYRAPALRYYAATDGAEAEISEPEEPTREAEAFGAYRLSRVKEELASLKDLLGKLSPRGGEVPENEPNVATVYEIIDWISKYERGTLEADAAKKELLQLYTEELFSVAYKGLLDKFRTVWAQRVQEDRKPLFFNARIKPIARCCKDVLRADFSLRGIYALLEKLDGYHRNAALAAEAEKALQTYGLGGLTKNLSALRRLVGWMEGYLAERENHALDRFAGGNPSFREYLAEKAESYGNALRAAENLRVRKDVTVAELCRLTEDYKTVRENNLRIAQNKALTGIFPSVKKNAVTDWAGILSALDTVERVRGLLREEKRTMQEDCEGFTRAVRALGAGGSERIAALLRKYESFYGDGRFDSEVTGGVYGVHSGKDMTLADFENWLAQIEDVNTLTEYAVYRKRVKELDVYGKRFFEWYAKEGRKEYPLHKMRDYYEIAILHAYYARLLEKSEYMAKLSGNDGITTVRSVVERFAAADGKSLEFNRKILDNRFYANVSRTASAKGNLHNYLRSMPKGANASVRRLLQSRSESVRELAPCMMMSVYSVSKLLDYGQYRFDVVIFDEASQIPAEDALPALMRAKSQVIIAGDPKQMPAVSYFKSTASAGTENDGDGEYEPCQSIIDFVIRAKDNAIAYERLDMHYRSNHESLIKYSNENPLLYGGNLVTFPSPKARTEEFGLWSYCLPDDERFRNVPITGGGGENESEARAVTELIRRHFEKYPLPAESEREDYRSLGVIVFGTKQKKLILSMMQEEEFLREIAALHDNRVFFITTADEIQGDEASEMILSLTYGRDETGKRTQAWGHLNRHPVALYKFNVAVTRARDNLKFVHSVRANEITNENLGYVAEYLRQLENFGKEPFVGHREYNTDFVEAIGRICESVVGKERVVYNYGESPRSYRVPISILTRDKRSVALGILCEVNRGTGGRKSVGGAQTLGAESGQGFSVREYCRTCNKILESHDWTNLYETYAMQWVRNYRFERCNLIEKLKEIL